MAGITSPPLQLYGIDSERQNLAELTYYQLSSVADNLTALGTNQATGLQLGAANNRFTTVAANTGCVLPVTSGPVPLAGLQLTIMNGGASFLNVYPASGEKINDLSANAGVVLMPASITAFYCLSQGVWYADGIGAGQSGSIETIASQGNVVSAGTSAGTATAVTQAIVNVSSGSGDPAGCTLMASAAGMQVAVANNCNNTIRVYATGSDTINGTAGATGVTQINALITLYICAVAGAWLTK